MASHKLAATDLNFDAVPAGTTVLDCSGNHQIWNFDGVPMGVKEVVARNCDNLTRVSGLPETVERLDCSESRVGKLEGLPAGLKELVANKTSVGFLNGIEGLSLTRLEIESTTVRNFDKLPKTLEILNVKDTSLTSLAVLPRGLRELNASHSSIRSLKGIPSRLIKLRINDCMLSESDFSTLPRTLRMLHVDGSGYTSRFKTLRGLPDSLTFLSMSNSALTSLEGCPKGLRALIVSDNQWLTSLRGIPRWPTALRALTCNDSPIDYIPLHALFALALDVDLPVTTVFRHKLNLVLNHHADNRLSA